MTRINLFMPRALTFAGNDVVTVTVAVFKAVKKRKVTFSARYADILDLNFLVNSSTLFLKLGSTFIMSSTDSSA